MIIGERIARALPHLRKVATQFGYMSLGSAIFFLIKVAWVYLAEKAGVAAWLSYLIISIALTTFGWAYHSKVTFKAGLSSKTALRYINASVGLKLFDYCGFVILTYAANQSPVVSAIIMSAMQVGARFLTYSTYVFREREPSAPQRLSLSNIILGVALLAGTVNYALAIDGAPPQKDGKQNYCAGANIYVFGVVSQDCDDESIDFGRAAPAVNEARARNAFAGRIDICPNRKRRRCPRLRCHQSGMVQDAAHLSARAVAAPVPGTHPRCLFCRSRRLG